MRFYIPHVRSPSTDGHEYRDGQPVRFVCRTQDGSKSFFFVTFQIVEEGNAAGAKGEEVAAVDPGSEDTLGVD